MTTNMTAHRGGRLAAGSLGLGESVIMGVAGTAPAFSVAATTAALVFMYRRRRLYFVPAVTVLATAALYSSLFVVMEGRYRKVIEPLLLVSVFWLVDARQSKRPAWQP